MRTVVVTNLPTPYRVPLFNRLQARLARRGGELHVIFGSETNQRRHWAVDRSAFQFEHRFLDGHNLKFAPDRIVNTYGGLRAELEDIAPDAVVATGFGLGTIAAARYARRHQTPCAIWSGAVPGSEGGLLRKTQRRWLIRRADGFLAYGSAARDYLVDLGAAPDATFLGWNTVDVTPFLARPAAIEPPPGAPLRLLTVAYLEPKKRIDLLLRALAEASERDLNLHLDIVGDGSDRENLEALAEELGVADCTTFHGNQPHDQMPGFYERADVFTFSSSYDVWGLVLVEAMASGRVPLASIAAGATGDLVVDGECGFALDFEDTRAVADRLCRLHCNRALVETMGAAARARIRDHFSLDNSVDGWIELLDHLHATIPVTV